MKPRRTLEDNEILYEQVKRVKYMAMFFRTYLSDLDRTSLLEVVGRLQYEQFRRLNTLFKKGDECNGKMYVLLEGEVYISLGLERKGAVEAKDPTIKLEPPKISRLQKVTKALTLLKAGRSNDGDDDWARQVGEGEAEEKWVTAHFGRIVRIMEPGECIGEKAFFDGGLRTATAIVKRTAHLLVLLKDDFSEVRRRFQENSIRRAKFITDHVPTLSDLVSREGVDSVLYSFEPQEHLVGTVILMEGERNHRLFLLEEGECTVTKKVKIKDEVGTEVNIQCCRIQPGSLIGEEILASFEDRRPFSDFTVTVSSPKATFYVIRRRNIFKFFPSQFRAQVYGLYTLKRAHRMQIAEELASKQVQREQTKPVPEEEVKPQERRVEPRNDVARINQIVERNSRLSTLPKSPHEWIDAFRLNIGSEETQRRHQKFLKTRVLGRGIEDAPQLSYIQNNHHERELSRQLSRKAKFLRYVETEYHEGGPIIIQTPLHRKRMASRARDDGRRITTLEEMPDGEREERISDLTSPWNSSKFSFPRQSLSPKLDMKRRSMA
eukprot:TRINITY_DN10729_c0_g1_i7.p1 TRINITY_DN10729_c0_g1~~TRINITY_DN10729_c0_g1_i7.p1  ORF type:complete len:549 (+),score=107.52 TRINITY_DN10729_c0_g1_i7:161-1807(+)